MNAAQSRHPKALPFLFLTEMWERFGFYIVQGLLVLYMTQYFGFSDSTSDTISGTFMGLVYISPFIGGFLADKLLGFKTAILWGGAFLVIGYAMLGFSSTRFLFYPALATIVVGNGLFKPNISSLLGTQYAAQDPRRDAGFTIFYIGINIGAALSGFSGYIKAAFGWHISFGLASLGLIIGLMAFLSGSRAIKHAWSTPATTSGKRSRLFICCLLVIAALSFLLKIHALASLLLPCAGIVLLAFLILLILQQPTEHRRRLIILTALIISSIVFWTLFFQLFISANLFVERLVDKNLFGIPLTTTVFYASEGLFIILLGPLFAWLWQTLGRRSLNPSPITKFVIGIFFAGLGFVILSTSTLFLNHLGLVHPLWVFFAYFLLTIGELFLSPIGLSAVTMLAPPQLIGMMMGVWFVGTGFGGIFAGMLAKFASVPESVKTNMEKLLIYQNAFLDFAYLAFFVAIVLFLMHLGFKNWLKDSQ